MKDIYFNGEGWVCERYPLDIKSDDNSNKIVVTEEKYNETFSQPNHYAWRVDNGQLVCVPFENVPNDEIKEQLRIDREIECFSYINRGKLWYDTLTELQLVELNEWYSDWLDVTETMIKPPKPTWLS